jgi:hypothetical protein
MNNSSDEYQKALNFLNKGCKCSCSQKLNPQQVAELRENFQALSSNKKDIFLIAQLQLMNGSKRCLSIKLKNKLRRKTYTFYQ